MKRITKIGIVAAIAAIALTGCSAPAGGSGGGDAGSESVSNSPADWANKKYGTFDVIDQSGTGDSIVTLPADSKAGIVTATHAGSANFSLQVLDAANAPTTDLLVNTIGSYTGTAPYGLIGVGEPGTSIKVTADGAWTIKISPVSTATELPEGGSGDGVFFYAGDASSYTFGHTGTANFSVVQYGDGLAGMNLLVNEIGTYSGTVPVVAGPSVIDISADGAWTAAKG